MKRITVLLAALCLIGCDKATLNDLPIEHTIEQVTVNNARSWYSGEYRHCSSNPPSGMILNCVADNTRKTGTEVIDVIYGNALDSQQIQEWECKRTSEGITCEPSQPKV